MLQEKCYIIKIHLYYYVYQRTQIVYQWGNFCLPAYLSLFFDLSNMSKLSSKLFGSS